MTPRTATVVACSADGDPVRGTLRAPVLIALVVAELVEAHIGAEITAVCGTANLDLARSLGAAGVIDYTSEDFTEDGDPVRRRARRRRQRSFRRCRRLLKRPGVFLLTDSASFGTHRSWCC